MNPNTTEKKTNRPGQIKERESNLSGSATANERNANPLPNVTLPKGGGAVKGIDEKFTVNAINGTNTASIPLPVGAARSGFSPGLSLSYSSGLGNGPFGLGWLVATPTIKRKTELELPKYQDGIDSDTFILSDAEDLVPLLKQNDITGEWEPIIRESADYSIKQYRPRIEGLWARIEQWKKKSNGEIHWRIISRNNITSLYGIDSDSRIADPSDESLKIFEWRLSHSFDDRGNLIVYQYKKEDFAGVTNTLYEKNRHAGNCTNLYLKRALYGNKTPFRRDDELPPENDFLFETVFDYGEHDWENPLPNDAGTWELRADAFSNFRAGFDIRTYRLCKRVLLYHKFDELPVNPYLISAVELGFDDFPGVTPSEDHLEGFTYLKSITKRGYLYHADTEQYTSKTYPPINYRYQDHQWNTNVKQVSIEDAYNAPVGIDFENYQWVDLYSEGLSGILAEKGDGWYYKRNRGNGDFTAATQVAPKPSFTGTATNALQLQDLEGVGDQYLVSLSAEPKGFFHLKDDGEWSPFQPFESPLNHDLLDNPYARFVDLNGDGLPDLLITKNELFEWHESKGAKGFGKANHISMPLEDEQGPRIVFSDPEQTIFLADMSGDGLTDIIRIRNGEVCYWANLGYGRFSMKISMANAPTFDHEERFNPAYLRLTDIDGSGTTDILYLGKNDFRIWMNLNGNRFTPAPKIIAPFPAIDNLADITTLDLLGAGTACIVWSSPLPSDSQAPLRYIDLMDSKKPHLLNYIENNMGREITFEYLPSTHFYLQDQKQGTPWATKLPFPVHVVAKVISEDRIRETLFTTSYSYHHGYFDGKEREFRGFGRVEQFDTEAFSSFSLNDAANVVTEEHHQPPVRTVRWFHTGAPLHKKLLTEIFAEEFYQNAALIEYQLPPSPMPSGLTIQEWREGLRTCKGLTLREEVYADDGSEKQLHPYSATQSTYQVRLIQPQQHNKHASFQIIANESISYVYERNPGDPRIAHAVTLETDDKGFVKKAASIIYPRQQRPTGIPDEVWVEQNQRHITYSEIDYTTDIETDDEYLIRTQYESRQYELLGLAQPLDQFITKQVLNDYLVAATTIPFEDTGDGSTQRRLFSHARRYFLRNDLNGGLPLAQRESLGLTYRTMQLAFTDGLVGQLYGGKVTAAMLTAAGYEHSEGDGDWWVPSGVVLYPIDAANNFYLADGHRDALGSESHITYDNHHILIESRSDAIGNTLTVENDYRTLSPHLITDPNLNRSAVVTDELGVVVKSVMMGKAGSGEGDTIDDPTAIFEYTLDNWLNHNRPNFVHTLTREQHGASNLRWQENYAYMDGSGGIIMSKVQAEPGLAKRWNPLTETIEEIDSANRWVGNGRIILNNKGNPIKQYEPYFSTTHEYEPEAELVETGVTSLQFYDPLSRNIRTEFPDGTFTKADFDPWQIVSYDPNDTVKESQWYSDRGAPDPLIDPEPADPEQRAAWLAAKHDNTPAISHIDMLGRGIYAVADHGNGKTTTVRTEMDSIGFHAKIYDQLNREISEGFTNLIGRAIYGKSAEKGEQWIFQDILGRMVRLWDNNLREFHGTYDVLHRPVSAFVLEDGTEYLFSHTVYGDGHPDAEALNLKGAAFQVYDQAGVTTIERQDFKGNLLNISRRLTREYRETVNWQVLDGLTDIGAIASAADPLLEIETFTGSSSYDALNRPTEAILPDGTVMRPHYNEANYLDSLEAQIMGSGSFITFLENQNYNARGQRESAQYGNNTLTRYFYDPKTFRLTNLLTTQHLDDAATVSMQNLRYTYDPIGNVTHVVDNAQQTHYFQNSVVRPEHFYEYDALYQLIKATGREHAGIGGNDQRNNQDLPFINQIPHFNDSAAVRNYTESYEYDDAGNILLMRHVSSDSFGNWTRRYRYQYQDDATNNTNRLAATSLPGDAVDGPYSATYNHDAHGNMTHMPHLQGMIWNFLNHLKEAPLGGGGTAFYVYGISGMRRRKVIERIGGRRIERIYLGAVEIYREYTASGTLSLERRTVHISDTSGRIAQVDTKTIDVSDSDPVNPLNISLIRYQYSNHLGSATLETDEDGNVISYEEYHPYGTSAYRSSKSDVDLSLKRYRFSGKERDDETGFYYFGARYYAAWLGRWTSSDPIGLAAGFNSFRYVHNNPITRSDPNGLDDRMVSGMVSQEIATALETNTDAARRTLNQHFSGHRITKENGEVLQFRENSFAWNAEHNQNLGVFDPVGSSDSAAEGEGGGGDGEDGGDEGGNSGSGTVGGASAAGAEAVNRNPEGFTLEVPDNFDDEKINAYEERIRTDRGVGNRSAVPGERHRPNGSDVTDQIRADNQHLRDNFNDSLPANQRASRANNTAIDHTVELQHIIRGNSTGGANTVRPQDHRIQDASLNSSQGSNAKNVRNSAVAAGAPEDVAAGGVARTSEMGRFYNSPKFRTAMRGFGHGLMVAGPVLGFYGASQVDNPTVRVGGYTAATLEAGGVGTYMYGRYAMGGANGFTAGRATMNFGGTIAARAGGVGQALLSGYMAIEDAQRGDWVAFGFDAAAAVGGVALVAATVVSAPALAVGLAIFGIATGIAAGVFHLGRAFDWW